MIEADNLCKTFGPVTALDGLGFVARDGEVTGLIGPNGAGKTTALRILYTVMRPDSGQALVDGLDTATQRGEVQHRIGVLADSRGLYPRLTAREHIRYKAYPSEPGLTTCWVCGCHWQYVRLMFWHAQPLERRPPDVPRHLRGALSR